MPVMTTEKKPTEKLHKLRDIAQMLNVHYNTVLNWVERKELPAFKFGDERGYRVADSDLKAFIQSKRTIQEEEQTEEEE